MIETIYIIFMILFLFGLTIFVHEWGHFIVARKCGLKVEAFAIGMGPALIQKKYNDVLYKVCIFPIGGYVSLPQLDPNGMEKLQGSNNPDDILPDISPWKKIAVAFAGPICNVIFALLLGWIVSFGNHEEIPAIIGKVVKESEAYKLGLRPSDKIIKVNNNDVNSWYDVQVEALLSNSESKIDVTVLRNGTTNLIQNIKTNNPEKNYIFINGVTEAIPCIVGDVISGDPADIAGLITNDKIKKINNKVIHDWNHFTDTLQNYPDQEVIITFERNKELKTKLIIPKLDTETERVLIGIKLGGTAAMPWTLHGSPFKQIKTDTTAIFRLLKALTTKEEAGQAAKGLGGPVAIFSMIWIALKMGLLNALALIRFININLAILNLLPIPVLDGGHIVMSLFEGITKKKIPVKLITFLINIFAILLITAMIWLSIRDVKRVTGTSTQEPVKSIPIKQE